jgi:hypothetical protein
VISISAGVLCQTPTAPTIDRPQLEQTVRSLISTCLNVRIPSGPPHSRWMGGLKLGLAEHVVPLQAPHPSHTVRLALYPGEYRIHPSPVGSMGHPRSRSSSSTWRKHSTKKPSPSDPIAARTPSCAGTPHNRSAGSDTSRRGSTWVVSTAGCAFGGCQCGEASSGRLLG